MMPPLRPLPVLLIMLACGCSRLPAPPAVQHPPAEDLTCPAEPPAPALSPDDDLTALRFDAAVLVAGRACRDALARVCRWHGERGMTGVACDAVPSEGK